MHKFYSALSNSYRCRKEDTVGGFKMCATTTMMMMMGKLKVQYSVNFFPVLCTSTVLIRSIRNIGIISRH